MVANEKNREQPGVGWSSTLQGSVLAHASPAPFYNTHARAGAGPLSWTDSVWGGGVPALNGTHWPGFHWGAWESLCWDGTLSWRAETVRLDVPRSRPKKHGSPRRLLCRHWAKLGTHLPLTCSDNPTGTGSVLLVQASNPRQAEVESMDQASAPGW